MVIGEKLRKIRVLHGLSRNALGKQIAASGGAVSMWENNKRVPTFKYRAAYMALGKSVGIPLTLDEFDRKDNGSTKP